MYSERDGETDWGKPECLPGLGEGQKGSGEGKLGEDKGDSLLKTL